MRLVRRSRKCQFSSSDGKAWFVKPKNTHVLHVLYNTGSNALHCSWWGVAWLQSLSHGNPFHQAVHSLLGLIRRLQRIWISPVIDSVETFWPLCILHGPQLCRWFAVAPRRLVKIPLTSVIKMCHNRTFFHQHFMKLPARLHLWPQKIKKLIFYHLLRINIFSLYNVLKKPA